MCRAPAKAGVTAGSSRRWIPASPWFTGCGAGWRLLSQALGSRPFCSDEAHHAAILRTHESAFRCRDDPSLAALGACAAEVVADASYLVAIIQSKFCEQTARCS